ncbi:type 4a pilus biogenesis protein PilO [Chloroflexota bacterium]
MKLKERIIRNKWFIIKLFSLTLYLVCMVAYFLWGIDYVYLGLVEKPTQEQEQLTQQIESSKKELANIPNLVVEREHQLVLAQELLANNQSRIPDTLNINDIVRNIIEVANECQVKAIPLSTTSPQSIIIGQSSYIYWSIPMSVVGDFQNIANFVESVDGKNISTGTVVSIVLNQNGENIDSSNTQNYVATVSGSLALVVYSLP